MKFEIGSFIYIPQKQYTAFIKDYNCDGYVIKWITGEGSRYGWTESILQDRITKHKWKITAPSLVLKELYDL